MMLWNFSSLSGSLKKQAKKMNIWQLGGEAN
jgi:hypothetical protein